MHRRMVSPRSGCYSGRAPPPRHRKDPAMNRLPAIEKRTRLPGSTPRPRSLASLSGRLRIALAATALLAAASAPAGAAIPRPEKAKLALQAEHPAVAAGETARIS